MVHQIEFREPLNINRNDALSAEQAERDRRGEIAPRINLKSRLALSFKCAVNS